MTSEPWETLNKSPVAAGGSFAPAIQFEKLEIHKVFLRFPNFNLEQNVSLIALADLFRASFRHLLKHLYRAAIHFFSKEGEPLVRKETKQKVDMDSCIGAIYRTDWWRSGHFCLFPLA